MKQEEDYTTPVSSGGQQPVPENHSTKDEKRSFRIQRCNDKQDTISKPYYLRGEKVTIGRSSDADVLLMSSAISRTHAILVQNSSGWSIQDSKSTNGVFVNGNKLKPFKNYLLYHHDVFSLGPPNDADFRYLFLQDEDPEESPSITPPCKMAKAEENEILICDNSLNNSPVSLKANTEEQELRSKLCELEKQLQAKEENEKILQEKLLIQEKVHKETIEKERERVKIEKAESEVRLKENLESELNIKEQLLREQLTFQQQALLNEKKQIEEMMLQKLHERDVEMGQRLQQEQQRLSKELAESEMKASYLETQLQQSINLQDQAKAQMLSQVGELMETELNCSICSELFIQALTLGCAHTFCLLCISQWKKKKKECPICRAKIKSETRSLVLDNFIEKMAESLPVQMKTSRAEIIASRSQPARKKKKY